MQSSGLSKIQQRIKQHGVTYKIEQLCLDQIKISALSIQASNIIQNCMKIEHLSLCSCELNSLINFPMLVNLSILELNNNGLKGQHLQPLGKLPKLYCLLLDLNQIEDYSWTRFLKRTRLAEISLKDNPITFEAEYREKVFKGLGIDLQLLDGIDRQGRTAQQTNSSFQQDDEEQEQEQEESDSNEYDQEVEQSEEGGDSLSKKMKLDDPEQAPQNE